MSPSRPLAGLELPSSGVLVRYHGIYIYIHVGINNIAVCWSRCLGADVQIMIPKKVRQADQLSIPQLYIVPIIADISGSQKTRNPQSLVA